MSSKITVPSSRPQSNAQPVRILPERESRRLVEDVWPEISGQLACAVAEASRIPGLLDDVERQVETLYDRIREILDREGVDPFAVEPPGSRF